jgi:hypothetical protein
MTDPDCVIALETMTVISEGTVAGGGVLFPVAADHTVGQAGLSTVFVNPLKAAGPLLRELLSVHWAPQNSTVAPGVATASLITKNPGGVLVLVVSANAEGIVIAKDSPATAKANTARCPTLTSSKRPLKARHWI